MPTRLLVFEREHPADLEFFATALKREFPALSIHTAADDQTALSIAAEAEVLFAKAHSVSAALVAGMRHLRWIQALTTGTDHLESLALPPSVTITSARGVHGPQMSELALMLMMALARDLPRMLSNQQQRHWERWPQSLLLGKTVVIVGIGAIAEELAVRCRALGMRVEGVSDARSNARGFDAVHPRSELRRAAARADFLVALVPYGPATHHLIDRSVLEAMPRTSRFINIARGRVVDEAALIEALELALIAGAGLDVFAIEPLPRESPLWQMPNVIITPRIGGMSDIYAQQLLPLLSENLATYLSGNLARLRNVVRRGSTDASEA
jgi:D-2-hydroxyacid dehydrogenase (NADP+)